MIKHLVNGVGKEVKADMDDRAITHGMVKEAAEFTRARCLSKKSGNYRLLEVKIVEGLFAKKG